MTPLLTRARPWLAMPSAPNICRPSTADPCAVEPGTGVTPDRRPSAAPRIHRALRHHPDHSQHHGIGTGIGIGRYDVTEPAGGVSDPTAARVGAVGSGRDRGPVHKPGDTADIANWGRRLRPPGHRGSNCHQDRASVSRTSALPALRGRTFVALSLVVPCCSFGCGL